ncbi:MAG: two-component system response regulator [Acidimicrobiia bacterium]|nr:two-component system response regulator [Acidimicrobiia bacterium]
MPARVMVIEDDPTIGQVVTDALIANGYRAQWCINAATATEAVNEDPPDLVLLDLGLPDIDGFTLCRWLREQHRALPVVVVTARDSDIDIVVGLDAGASDYVTKPFSMSVLLARVRAHLRTNAGSGDDGRWTIRSLCVDPAAFVATINGEPIGLRRREFELLAVLCREAGRVVTRQQLLAEVWDLHWDSSTKTLDMHVLALRRKLGDAVEIVTVRGVGYRLVSE